MRFGQLAAATVLIAMAGSPVASCAMMSQKRQETIFAPVTPIIATIIPNIGCDHSLPIREEGATLDVPHFVQRVDYANEYQSNLCWATVVSMTSAYFGILSMPCENATYDSNGVDCCALQANSPKKLIKSCNHGVDPGIAWKRLNIKHTYENRPMTDAEIRFEISNGRPLVPYIELDRPSKDLQKKTYHVFIIAGYKDDRYLVLNPNRNSSDSLSYEQLMYGDAEQWIWKGTWYRFSTREDGCNPRFNPSCDCTSR